ncbi:hypothetical protein D3C81_1523180 [compost metagenome]
MVARKLSPDAVPATGRCTCGTRTVKARISPSSTPGAPMRMNAQRQPCSSAIQPPRPRPTTAPIAGPIRNTARARERRWRGYRSETIATDGAEPPASPTATRMRNISSIAKLVARPQSMVVTLQAMQATATTGLRPIRSERRPSGRPNTV